MQSLFKKLSAVKLLLIALLFIGIQHDTKAQTVTCPSETNLGPYDCSIIGDPTIYQIQVIPDWLELVTSPPYNMQITGVLPQTGLYVSDSDILSFCPNDAREIIRTMTIYNDENFNFQYDVGEEIGSCIYTIITQADLTNECALNCQTNGVVVICPTETNFGPFDCNNIQNVPSPVNTIEDAYEIYGIEVTGATILTGAVTIDSDLVFYCEDNAREVTREIVIYNDENNNFQYDDGEEIEACVFTITTIADVEPPTFIAPPDVNTTCLLDDGYYGAPGFMDNCDVGPPSQSVNFTDQPNDVELCPGEKSFVRAWTVTDSCGNVGEPQFQNIVVKCQNNCPNSCGNNNAGYFCK